VGDSSGALFHYFDLFVRKRCEFLSIRNNPEDRSDTEQDGSQWADGGPGANKQIQNSRQAAVRGGAAQSIDTPKIVPANAGAGALACPVIEW